MHIRARAASVQSVLQIFCLVCIVFLGAFLRFATADGTVVDHPVRNDGRDYVAYAWNLKSFNVYSKDFNAVDQPDAASPLPDAYRPPGYPLMLRALLHDRVDPDFWVRTVHVQAWLAVLTLVCSLWLAIALLGRWPGLLIGLLVAISPHQTIYVPYFLTETLYGAVLMMALTFAVISLKVVSWKWRMVCAGVAGIFFAATCLVRPTLNQWVPLLLLLLLVPRIRRFHREILMCSLAFFLVMAPWWVRNVNSTREISDAGQMRVTVQQGSYPDLMYKADPATLGYPYAYDPASGKASSSWANVFSDLRTKFASEPLTMLSWYAVGKTAFFFHWSPPDGWHDMFTYPVWRSPWLTNPLFILLSAIMRVLYVPLIVCGLLGTFTVFFPRTSNCFSARNTDSIRFLALLHIFAIGVHVVGAPFARYSVPFRPLTFLLAVFFLLWVIRNYRYSRPMTTAVADSG
jgi:hypothetical protein